MSEMSAEAMQAVFSSYVASTSLDGAIGAVADLLTSGGLTRVAFDEVVREFGVEESTRFREGLLDLLLHCIRAALADHTLTTEEVALIRIVSTVFRVREGEFYARRRAEVADILQREVHRILEDDVVDVTEALYQEELQRIFGLGYDQYVELTRPAFNWAVERAIAEVARGSEISDEGRARLDRRLAALKTVYVFTPAQKRRLGLVG